MIGKTFLLSLVLFLALGLLAFGQSKNERALESINDLRIVVESLTPKSEQCGATESQLNTAVAFPLSQTRIRIHNSASVGFLYVRINSLLTQYQCSHARELSLQLPATIIANDHTKYTVSVWDQTGAVLEPRNVSPRNLLQELENAAKEFAIQWSKVNPPK